MGFSLFVCCFVVSRAFFLCVCVYFYANCVFLSFVWLCLRMGLCVYSDHLNAHARHTDFAMVVSALPFNFNIRRKTIVQARCSKCVRASVCVCVSAEIEKEWPKTKSKSHTQAEQLALAATFSKHILLLISILSV